MVDNGSRDGVCEDIPADIHVRVVQLDNNSGYAGGMRAGVDAILSPTTWILMLTHEVVLDSHCAQQLVQVGEETNAAQVGPSVRSIESGRRWSLGGSFSKLGNTTHAPGLSRQETEPRTVIWLEGCCHLVRRAAIEPSFWDDRYFLYWDDVDMSQWLSQKGPIICVPTARCWQGTSGQMTYFSARNRIMYWRKHRRPLYVAAALAETAIRVAQHILRGETAQAMSRLHGSTDGLSGRLRTEYWEARSL